MDQTRLGSALLNLYRKVVENNIVEHKILREGFNNISALATSTDYENREHSVIMNRFEVEQMMNIMQNNQTVFRSYIDQTMRFLLDIPKGEISWDKWIKRYITKYLLLFMQGITIFESRGNTPNEKIGRPAYHRISSCGPWNSKNPTANKDFERNHLTCSNNLDTNELNRRRRNIWTCLVERLVYDKLYNYFIGNQDFGHILNEKRVTIDLFEKCFSINNIYIDAVTLQIDTNYNIPVGMRIQYETPKYRIVEKYIRNSVNNRNYSIDVQVTVRKEVQPLGDGPGDEYERVQSYFNTPKDWLPISPGNIPLNGGSKYRKWKPNCPKIPDPFHGKF